MSDLNRHIIQKQIFDLTFPKGKDVLVMQELVSKLSREGLAPALEKTFDQYVSKEMSIRLDKLEIDLGNIPLAEMEQVFVPRIIKAIVDQLLVEIKKKEELEKKTIYNYFEAWLRNLKRRFLPW